MDATENFNISPRFTPRRNVPPNNDATAAPTPGAGQSSDFEYQFLRVLNKVYQTIEKNEMRLGEHDRKEATRVEWQQKEPVLNTCSLVSLTLEEKEAP
ncbi:hypothetical protein SK128_010265 [Halocaridina rubra]|uniref:Uncharacterized protein n=1 Tax=Halocaridina rubra TaxID=373956 RepID=A0AAN8WJ73_HALRR